MYRVIAVDDELISLKRFEHIIQKESRLELIQTFSDPLSVPEFISNNPVDIVFLDIEMPEMNGLELAEKILEIDPYTNIIFLTAFDQYALDAFQAHAIGYLLKPLDIKSLSGQINILEKKYSPRENIVKKENVTASSVKPLTVRCLGQFNCFPTDNENEPISFRTAKTAELFALLIHHYKTPISKYSILDNLFPDMDYEKSNKLFYVSCSYLRSTMSKAGINDVFIRENDTYRINTAIVDCDYFTLMDNEGNILSDKIELLQKLGDLCNGEYFMGKSYEWVFETRAYVETLSKRIFTNLANAYLKRQDTERAIQTLEKCMIIDPCNESVMYSLINVYMETNQLSKARASFQTFRTKLMDQLGVEPSKNIVDLIKSGE